MPQADIPPVLPPDWDPFLIDPDYALFKARRDVCQQLAWACLDRSSGSRFYEPIDRVILRAEKRTLILSQQAVSPSITQTLFEEVLRSLTLLSQDLSEGQGPDQDATDNRPVSGDDGSLATDPRQALIRLTSSDIMAAMLPTLRAHVGMEADLWEESWDEIRAILLA